MDKLGIKKYYIYTFGCQMNVHDSEKIAGILTAKNYELAYNPNEADLIIFNTCSIRQKAEQKFYSQLGKLKILKKKNPKLKIAVAGCIAQQEGDNLIKKVPYVDHVLGPQNLEFFNNIFEEKEKILALEENPHLQYLELPIKRIDKVKAFVNIMYGCDNFCSYCIVPFTRGRERSRPSSAIIKEVKQLSEQGFKEVILLGQNVNSYKSQYDFPGLLRELNRVGENIKRIRFVTSHPKDFSLDLIHAIRDLDKVCEHIHLPLQSGSDKILELMNRKYSFKEYMKKIEILKKEIPNIAITSDIISGFPQETEEDHKQTINALREIEFDGIFAFKFSKRRGTKASQMEGHIAEEVKSERLSEILKIQDEITERKNKELEGTIQEILIEGFSEKSADQLTGRTRTNKIFVSQKSNKILPGDIVKALIIKGNKHSIFGNFLI
ncbi:MAG: tRNA (N6-isopentenyl adenosine(37)-C2)-methylthiotransferase MiaB [Thermodesulfovibrionales bacterium]|nr:tRNA (N6-isopentenyl adenosine(37)-C2)-methylthiotransferase MiaB [Thermodesulfovibrionales bacterium]